MAVSSPRAGNLSASPHLQSGVTPEQRSARSWFVPVCIKHSPVCSSSALPVLSLFSSARPWHAAAAPLEKHHLCGICGAASGRSLRCSPLLDAKLPWPSRERDLPRGCAPHSTVPPRGYVHGWIMTVAGRSVENLTRLRKQDMPFSSPAGDSVRKEGRLL